MTSKLSMRAKKLQYNVKLRIYNAEDVVLEDQSAVRSMIHVQTGVEKDEEEEHHLQRFISASQLDGPKTAFYIPTPDASKEITGYDDVYKPNYVRPPKNIRLYNAIIDELAATDTYDLDEEDDKWIRTHNTSSKSRALSEEQVEKVITKLEQLANEKKEPDQALPNLSDLGPDAAITGESASAIYDYWRKKRERLNRSLINLLKPETKQNDPDPYVCFRRRELRQTRKSRRNDQQSYEKLVKLRTELDRARTIVDLMRKRDRLKKEQLLLELLIFEQKTRIHAIELRHPELAIKKDKREPQMHMQPQQFSMRPTERIVIRLPTDMDSAAATGGRANYADRRPQQTAMPPPLEPEPIQDWRNGPPDHVFRGTDLQHNTYNRLLDLPLAPNMPEASYVDLTHAIQWEPKKPVPGPKQYRQVFIDGKCLTSSRLRMGRNGRLWIDQSSKFESHLRSVPLTDATKDSKFNEQRTNVKSSRKRTLFDLSDDDDVNYYHDEVIGDETEDAEIEVPKNFMYGPIAFCLPQEMQYLNGGAETVNIQKGRQLLRLSNASIGMSNSANAGMYHGMGANGPPKKIQKIGNGIPGSPSTPTFSAPTTPSSLSSPEKQRINKPGMVNKHTVPRPVVRA